MTKSLTKKELTDGAKIKFQQQIEKINLFIENYQDTLLVQQLYFSQKQKYLQNQKNEIISFLNQHPALRGKGIDELTRLSNTYNVRLNLLRHDLTLFFCMKISILLNLVLLVLIKRFLSPNISMCIYMTPGIYSEEQIVGWKLVTEAVHAKGGLIYLQLWYVGRISHPTLQPGGIDPVAPSAIAPVKQRTFIENGTFTEVGMPRALELEEIPKIVEDYRKATRAMR